MCTRPEASLSSQTQPRAGHGAGATVARNTAFLVIAQVLGMPLSLLLNAIMARKLGPTDFGNIYLAGTLVAFGFLVVEWGQSGTLPAMIARDHRRAGALLGSGLAWRLTAGVLVYGVLALVARLLGYGTELQAAVALVAVARVVGTTTAAYLDAGRGFENSSITAASQVRYNVLCAAIVIPTLLFGGRMLSVLVALIFADAINLIFVLRSARVLNFGKLSVRQFELRDQLAQGATFMFLGLALRLQPNVDAILLSKLGTASVIGWHAAAQKLVGLLVFPVSAIASALYPTLCRLHAESSEAFREMLNGTLRTSSMIVVPVVLGCALYADLGILIFSKELFKPAADNLRILSLFILLLYFSMILGSALAASGKQKSWTVTQFACVFVSAIADPFLIPWFQTRTGNGGLGVCVSTVLSELLMVAVGFWLAPRGLIDRRLLLSSGAALLAGAGMAIVSLLLTHVGVNPFISAPFSVLTYGICLWFLGELDRERIAMLKTLVSRPRPAG
jgi:O-antigen/teichoic acid export membrane protein